MAPKRQNTLASRIKSLMRADEEVGKIGQASPVVIGRATELLVGSIMEGAAKLATERGSKTLTQAHIKAHVLGEPTLDFLKDIVATAPDLPPEGEGAPKEKRKRAEGVSRRPSGKGARAMESGAGPASPRAPKQRKLAKGEAQPMEASGEDTSSEDDEDTKSRDGASGNPQPPASNLAEAAAWSAGAGPVPPREGDPDSGCLPSRLAQGFPPNEHPDEGGKGAGTAGPTGDAGSGEDEGGTADIGNDRNDEDEKDDSGTGGALGGTASGPVPPIALPSVPSLGAPALLAAKPSLVSQEDDYD
eukprot:jgi/Botrbrau1/2769/Bobra.0164s0046.1